MKSNKKQRKWKKGPSLSRGSHRIQGCPFVSRPLPPFIKAFRICR